MGILTWSAPLPSESTSGFTWAPSVAHRHSHQVLDLVVRLLLSSFASFCVSTTTLYRVTTSRSKFSAPLCSAQFHCNSSFINTVPHSLRVVVCIDQLDHNTHLQHPARCPAQHILVYVATSSATQRLSPFGPSIAR